MFAELWSRGGYEDVGVARSAVEMVGMGAGKGQEFCGKKCPNQELNLGLHGHNVLS